jgi:ATP-dependent Clp protease protease subunit
MFYMPGQPLISQFNEGLRRIILSGIIEEALAAQFLEQLTSFEYLDLQKPVSIYIDTCGGSVSSGLLIYDAIRSCSAPCITIGAGKTMSIGTLILAAGEKGQRYVYPNTRLLLHEISSGAVGTLSEMDNSVAEARTLQKMYIDLLAKETGQTTKKIAHDISRGDYYLSAQQAIKYGLADKIVPTRKAPKKPAPAAKKSK